MAAPTSTLNEAVRRVADAYERLPDDRRPGILGPAWSQREAAIDAAYVARDSGAFKTAVEEWERFAVSVFEAASE